MAAPGGERRQQQLALWRPIRCLLQLKAEHRPCEAARGGRQGRERTRQAVKTGRCCSPPPAAISDCRVGG